MYKPIPQNAKLNKIDKIIEIDQSIVAPISANQVLGKLIFRSDDKYLGEVNLIAEKAIPKKETWLTIINSNFFLKTTFLFLVVFPFCCAVLLAAVILIHRMTRKKKRFFKKKNSKDKQSIFQRSFLWAIKIFILSGGKLLIPNETNLSSLIFSSIQYIISKYYQI